MLSHSTAAALEPDKYFQLWFYLLCCILSLLHWTGLCLANHSAGEMRGGGVDKVNFVQSTLNEVYFSMNCKVKCFCHWTLVALCEGILYVM